MLTHGLSDFRCAQCFQPFPEGTFYEFEGRKYCEHDFRVLFAPSCGKCGKLHVCVLLLLLLIAFIVCVLLLLLLIAFIVCVCVVVVDRFYSVCVLVVVDRFYSVCVCCC